MAKHVEIPKITNLQSLIISQERSGGWRWVFGQMTINVFNKLTLSILMGIARHAWDTLIYSQYLKNELSYEVDVLPADKDESLLQVNVQGAWASLKFEENRTEFKNLTLLAGSSTYDILYI